MIEHKTIRRECHRTEAELIAAVDSLTQGVAR